MYNFISNADAPNEDVGPLFEEEETKITSSYLGKNISDVQM